MDNHQSTNNEHYITTSPANHKTTNHRDSMYLPDDGPLIFVPAETIRVIEKVIETWNEVRRQWKKMA